MFTKRNRDGAIVCFLEGTDRSEGCPYRGQPHLPHYLLREDKGGWGPYYCTGDAGAELSLAVEDSRDGNEHFTDQVRLRVKVVGEIPPVPTVGMRPLRLSCDHWVAQQEAKPIPRVWQDTAVCPKCGEVKVAHVTDMPCKDVVGSDEAAKELVKLLNS